MKKIEKEFMKSINRNVKTKHTFEDIKKELDFNTLPRIKDKKKTITLISVLSGSALVLGLVAILLTITPIKPNLDLAKYRVDFRNAEGIGVIPNNKQNVFVTKNKNTGELEPVNFLSKNSKTNKNLRSIRGSGDESFEALAKKQKALGWEINKYFIYDNYTFVQFVLGREFFEERDHYLSTHLFREDIPKPRYRGSDFDIRHYYNGNGLTIDWAYYEWNYTYHSYVIDNNTGLIYALDFLEDDNPEVHPDNINKGLYFYNNILYMMDGYEHQQKYGHYVTRAFEFFDEKQYYRDNMLYAIFPNSDVVNLSLDGDNLSVSLIKDFPESTDYYKDRYGQYFAPAIAKEGIDVERKINIVSQDIWNTHLTTSDNRFLIVKDGKLYEYLDNFVLEEVPDGVTYKCSGYNIDYSFINNKYIFNPSENVIIDIASFNVVNEWERYGVLPINAIMISGDNYFYVDTTSHKLKSIKNPFALYSQFKETHPDANIPLLYGDGLREEYKEVRIGIYRNISYPQDVNAEYKALLYANSVELEDVVSWNFNKEEIHGSEVFESYYTAIHFDDELVVNKWTMSGNEQYIVQIDENDNVSFVKIEDYEPKQVEYILTPIN